jgi:hypothetical protein
VRVRTVVVLPVPPFWERTAIVVAIGGATIDLRETAWPGPPVKGPVPLLPRAGDGRTKLCQPALLPTAGASAAAISPSIDT